ncbi:hypothetical protein HanRHA438_Chr09g0375441 [Helianthus annuus]|nr:hypothetical protein HanRHA438_Chr09g0375441 [Helianthus annuus]
MCVSNYHRRNQPSSAGYRRLHRRNQPSLPSCYNFPATSPEKRTVIRRLFIIHIKDRNSGELRWFRREDKKEYR